jgi:hypothetical protein
MRRDRRRRQIVVGQNLYLEVKNMHEGSVETEKRIAAWRALREAKAALEEIIADAVRMSDTRPVYNKIKKWLPVVAAAEKDVGNVIGDLDPLAHVMAVRQVAAKLRQLGQRKTDEIAAKLEHADSLLME